MEVSCMLRHVWSDGLLKTFEHMDKLILMSSQYSNEVLADDGGFT